ncbi:NADPH-dependent 2,4-dienoyl-CoA reductase, sulfur reductase [Enhydrobacter aerosaccus]|uniref:NADPH-dependent 2,4-dienoyl-CoA reductase, sulfur reductase n=1 Tax=Enhydrobacter aerosaccus TaxID=225324 RepID=A0A1T4K6N6_9HYPH|nr:NAD(P)/FAD-dependent oxidoreductase [Enhydrobacter aerosaccus]SJZ38081.1 NADPH-dependent 2,4-dienoyl-CoA reductase, sulfur reductase [Enhydrobacter aerosaccus]
MKIAVVGAGPAGVRAVEVLVAAGHRPIWIDEAPDGGGRIYQRPPAALRRNARELYGFESTKAAALHGCLDRLKPLVDWRPETLVWHIHPGRKTLYMLNGGMQATAAYDAVLLCTGAMDRVIPLQGWTQPGVTTLGAAQIAVKAQGCAIGHRVALVGTGPLLWLVAHQYAKAGAQVAVVIDTTSLASLAAAAPGLLRDSITFAKGLYYMGSVKARGIPTVHGAIPLAIEHDETAVTGVRFRDARGREQRVACDAVGMGWGLKPESQLADLAGIPFDFDPLQHNWLPERDATGRTPVASHYLAGDGASIGGAAVAELAGARAAWAILQDAGRAIDTAAVRRLDRALARQRKIRAALERAFPFPVRLAADLADDIILCRCEGLRAGELRAAAVSDLNRTKALTRTGMGRCQGRICGVAASEVLAAAVNQETATLGRLRGQPPVKPMPVTSLPAREHAA